MKRILLFPFLSVALLRVQAVPTNDTVQMSIYSTGSSSYLPVDFDPATYSGKFFGFSGGGVPGFYAGTAAFANITGVPGDNAALATALGNKLDLTGGEVTGLLTAERFSTVPGAAGDGTTDDTAAIQAVLDAGLPVWLPPATYKITTLELPSGATIIGSGWTQTTLLSAVTGNTAIIRNKTGATTSTRGVTMANLKIQGTPGNGGTGLWLNSFSECSFTNVRIELCRNSGDTGRGLYMENQYGNCSRNDFHYLWVDNCDDAITLDGTSSMGVYGTGYNTFTGVYIGQEVNSIALLTGTGNGGAYNNFYGVMIQGTGQAGTYLNIEGSGNSISGIDLDAPGSGNVLVFANSGTQGNVVNFNTGFNVAKYVNNQSSGRANIVTGTGGFTYSPGRSFVYSDAGDITASFQGGASNSGVEMRYGNGTSSTQWRHVMQTNVSPTFTLQAGSTIAQRWTAAGAGSSLYAGGSEVTRLTSSGLAIKTGGVSANASTALHVQDTTASTSVTTGAVRIDGGLGVAGTINAGVFAGSGAGLTNLDVTSISAGTTGTGTVVRANSPTLTTANLGTPSAINLANASGTMTNVRTVARLTSITSHATPAVNTDNCECVTITALATAITSMTTNLTGTPYDFDKLKYRIKDDGTARAINWGASFATGTGTLPSTTTAGKTLHVSFEWDAVQSKWICMTSGSEP